MGNKGNLPILKFHEVDDDEPMVVVEKAELQRFRCELQSVWVREFGGLTHDDL